MSPSLLSVLLLSVSSMSLEQVQPKEAPPILPPGTAPVPGLQVLPQPFEIPPPPRVPVKADPVKVDDPSGPTRPKSGATKVEPKVVAAIPGDVEVNFLNGSIVRMVVHSDKVDIATTYGKLTVPLKDVRTIEFGLHFPEGAEARIAAAIKNLGSENFRERDAASKVLVDLGPYSYPAVNEAALAGDTESSRRARDVVKRLQANHAKKDLKTASEDKIVTPNFTIVGRILTPTIKARTELFGEVEIAVAKMRTLRSFGDVGGREADFTIDAVKFAVAGEWMDTRYRHDGRSGLAITAKGLVDTWPQDPGQYMATPAGAGAGGGGRIMVINGGQIVQAGGFGPGNLGGLRKGAHLIQAHGGALFGKIGEDGEPFLIGDRFEGALESTGNLFLHIAPSPWSCPSTGSFEVNVQRKH